MSMMGGPKVLLLDEPSTGMDPSAKRFLWYVVWVCSVTYRRHKAVVLRNIISDCITDQRAAILTTHSMEEADALCSRVGIMVSGSLRLVTITLGVAVKKWVNHD